MSRTAWAAWLLLATAVMVLAWAVARRQITLARMRLNEHRRGRHVIVSLPMLAPERWCACGCTELAAPGALLAAWHYEPPAGVLPPAKAVDSIPLQGLAWTYGDDGDWQPAIVYVMARHQPEPAHGQPVPEAELRDLARRNGHTEPELRDLAATNGHDSFGRPAT